MKSSTEWVKQTRWDIVWKELEDGLREYIQGNFPDGPVVKTVLLIQKAQVRFLVKGLDPTGLN